MISRNKLLAAIIIDLTEKACNLQKRVKDTSELMTPFRIIGNMTATNVTNKYYKPKMVAYLAFL